MSFHSYFSWQTFLLSWWRASIYSGSVRRKLVIKSKKDKAKGKGKCKSRERDRRGGGECGQCTVLACPPHPTQSLTFSLHLFLCLTVEVEKPSTNIGYFLPFVSLNFLCNCLCLLPLLTTCKWVWRSHTLNFLILFDTFFPSQLSSLWFWLGLVSVIWVGGLCLQV